MFQQLQNPIKKAETLVYEDSKDLTLTAPLSAISNSQRSTSLNTSFKLINKRRTRSRSTQNSTSLSDATLNDLQPDHDPFDNDTRESEGIKVDDRLNGRNAGPEPSKPQQSLQSETSNKTKKPSSKFTSKTVTKKILGQCTEGQQVLQDLKLLKFFSNKYWKKSHFEYVRSFCSSKLFTVETNKLTWRQYVINAVEIAKYPIDFNSQTDPDAIAYFESNRREFVKHILQTNVTQEMVDMVQSMVESGGNHHGRTRSDMSDEEILSKRYPGPPMATNHNMLRDEVSPLYAFNPVPYQPASGVMDYYNGNPENIVFQDQNVYGDIINFFQNPQTIEVGKVNLGVQSGVDEHFGTGDPKTFFNSVFDFGQSSYGQRDDDDDAIGRTNMAFEDFEFENNYDKFRHLRYED